MKLMNVLTFTVLSSTYLTDYLILILRPIME